MVSKLRKTTATKKSKATLTGSVRESAQQIWQAGLGALHQAQAEGSKAFEALAKEGASLQRKTQAAAEEKMLQASGKMAALTTDISATASGQWGKLETIFEERVAKALSKLGVPSAQEVQALTERIDDLVGRIEKLSAPRPAAKPVAKVVAKKAAPTTGRKTTRAATAAAGALEPAKPARQRK